VVSLSANHDAGKDDTAETPNCTKTMDATKTFQPTQSDRKACFGLVANHETRLLVLGTLPGSISLARGEYYANPSNQFWRLLSPVVGGNLPEMAYSARLHALLTEGIGLWDVVASAKRTGSLDTAIRECDVNSLETVMARLPSLKALAFNGGKAFQIGRRLCGHADVTLVPLPSSSAAYCAMSFEEKLKRWLSLKQFLANGLLGDHVATM
jgi:TDG/mug DNA glycosylase family protein